MRWRAPRSRARSPRRSCPDRGLVVLHHGRNARGGRRPHFSLSCGADWSTLPAVLKIHPRLVKRAPAAPAGLRGGRRGGARSPRRVARDRGYDARVAAAVLGRQRAVHDRGAGRALPGGPGDPPRDRAARPRRADRRHGSSRAGQPAPLRGAPLLDQASRNGDRALRAKRRAPSAIQLQKSFGRHRIDAMHLVRSDAAGSVLRKVGMRQEGILRERVRKAGRFEDVALCAMLAGGGPINPSETVVKRRYHPLALSSKCPILG